MTEGVIARNVRRIRSIKGLSQEAVAQKANVSRATYRNIENKKTIPRVNTLLSIAKALDVKLQDLVASEPKLTSVRFRSLKKLKLRNREQMLVDVATWLNDFNMLEKLLDDRIKFNLRKYRSVRSRRMKRIKDIAKCVRKELNLNDEEPIWDICGLLEKGGIKVFPYSLASEGFFGLSVSKNDGGPAVVVNVWERISVERWIFSAAHELGHLLLHLDSYDSKESEENPEEEKEANIFASYFLMPEDSFNKEWDDAYGLRLIDRVFKIKRVFKVSYLAILYRLNEMGKADNSIWKTFYTLLNEKYGRPIGGKVEPQQSDSEAFSSTLRAEEHGYLSDYDFKEDRLCRLVRKAIAKGQIAEGRGAEILRISIEEMRKWAKSWIID